VTSPPADYITGCQQVLEQAAAADDDDDDDDDVDNLDLLSR